MLLRSGIVKFIGRDGFQMNFEVFRDGIRQQLLARLCGHPTGLLFLILINPDLGSLPHPYPIHLIIPEVGKSSMHGFSFGVEN